MKLWNLIGQCAPWLLALLATGCVSMAASSLAGNIADAILNQDDPETVRAGAPAYLLMIDGLIAEQPDNQALLLSGAQLYGAYAAAFVEDEGRALRLTGKALAYARRALCVERPAVCEREESPYGEFVKMLPEMDEGDLPALYAYGASWAGWIQNRGGAWAAVADVPKVEAVMERVIELDEDYEYGVAHLYLGVIRTQLPPALGGKPEEGRVHFERAIELSEGRNLLAKVELADRYARLVFDQVLHDRLLNEVLSADVDAPGFVLSNTLAQERARRLLATSHQYFEE
ncbi:MAG: TRAP transporter TatT component family protein [Pseudomonadota bacterium]